MTDCKHRLECCLTNKYSGFTFILEWIFNKANQFKRFASIVVLKCDLTHFKMEKDLSFVDVVSGNTVRNNKNWRIIGKYLSPVNEMVQCFADKTFHWLINIKNKIILLYVSISMNQRL